MDKTKLYSPTQAVSGAFLGGPLAAVYVVWRNFKALGKPAEARWTLLWGATANIAILFIAPFLPARFPPILIPVIYSAAVRYVVETQQLNKKAISSSEQYDFQSNWEVVGIALLCLVIFFIAAIALYLLLDAMGAGILDS